MCEICHKVTCPSSCPNAEQPAVVATCDWCNDEIEEGDTYYEIGDETVCEECINDCKKTAEVED